MKIRIPTKLFDEVHRQKGGIPAATFIVKALNYVLYNEIAQEELMKTPVCSGEGKNDKRERRTARIPSNSE